MAILYVVLVAIHIAACLFLIAVILLQAGRGGGLVESFNISESIFGTKTSSFLQKATTACAITFIFSCLALAFITAQKSKSLMRKPGIVEHMLPLPEEENQVPEVQVTPEAGEQPKSEKPEETQEPVTIPEE